MKCNFDRGLGVSTVKQVNLFHTEHGNNAACEGALVPFPMTVAWDESAVWRKGRLCKPCPMIRHVVVQTVLIACAIVVPATYPQVNSECVGPFVRTCK